MIYDIIIYPANLPGIAAAIKLTTLGKKVLLLNNYGFPGGNIASALNIYQKKIQANQSVTYSIYRNLFSENGILDEDENHIFLNPEIFKFVCQRFLENSETELLFHIQPVEIIKNHDIFQIKVIGKEGLIELGAQQILDVGERQELSFLLSSESRQFVSQKINLISSTVSQKIAMSEIDSAKIFSDGRLYISALIDTDEVVENKAQEFLTNISLKLNIINSRIQIAPVESQVRYQFTQIENIDGLINLVKMNLAELKEDEYFINSQKIERYFD